MPVNVDTSWMLDELTETQGPSIVGRAVTARLHVSPNGNNFDGSSWTNAYTTIQAALDAASTDVNECTLILVGINTGSNNYDINTAGDPTWSCNVIIMGSHRTWAKIKNTHASATSIMKLTGRVSLIDLNFNLHTGSVNGVILTGAAFRVNRCQFVGHDLTGVATALHIDGATNLKHGKIEDVYFVGHATYMTGLLLDNVQWTDVKKCTWHDCLTGLQIVNTASDENFLHDLEFGDCATAIDIDAGNGQHIHHIDFHGNTTNIDDEVGDHYYYNNLHGEFSSQLLPDNFTGVSLGAGAANVWGSDTEVLSAASRDKPFRVNAISVEADATEKFRVRLSADSGSTFFVDFQMEGTANANKRESIQLPAGTGEIFNHGTRISGSCKSESGGNNAIVWVEIQEI